MHDESTPVKVLRRRYKKKLRTLDEVKTRLTQCDARKKEIDEIVAMAKRQALVNLKIQKLLSEREQEIQNEMEWKNEDLTERCEEEEIQEHIHRELKIARFMKQEDSWRTAGWSQQDFHSVKKLIRSHLMSAKEAYAKVSEQKKRNSTPTRGQSSTTQPGLRPQRNADNQSKNTRQHMQVEGGRP